MKKQLRTHPALKALAVILALVLGAGGFWASLFTLSQWDDIWTGTGYYESSNCYSNLYNRLAQVRELAWLMQNRTWDGSLSYLDQQRLEALQEALSPEQTNFRFRLVDNATGEPVYGNLPGGQTMEGAVYRVLSDSLELQRYNGGHEDDYQTWDQEMDYYQLHIIQSDGSTLLFLPEEESVANQYGWLFNGSSWDYYEELDRRVLSRVLAVEYGVTNPQTVTDEFTEGAQDYLEYAQYLPGVALLSLALDVLTVLLVVFLCLGAGRRRDREGVLLNHFDRIPLDLLIFLEFWALAALLALGDSMAWALNSGALNLETAVGLGVLSLGISGCLLAFLLTLATRIKTRTVFSNTLTWLLCRAIGRLCRALGRSWPLTWRVVVLFLLYLLGSVLTALTVFLIPVYQGLALYFLCRWTIQWRRVREGAARIVGGDPSCKIDTGGKMYPDLREHAEQLNDLGGAIRTAVDRQLKSERFKAELITNVSHDLKTPLTSIINYVDLLKKEEIQNPRAAEYIEVLDRKSQRLKKLTEDLVEASKASSGVLNVDLQPTDVNVLFSQIEGEYQERLAACQLTLVTQPPAPGTVIRADSRLLSRVMDNLVSNICKYALPGTRVYVVSTLSREAVTISFKNVSRDELNISPDELMERFVRGDASRHTEGSGLGLSIARSLVQLQGGRFDLAIDADLFRADITFPLSESAAS